MRTIIDSIFDDEYEEWEANFLYAEVAVGALLILIVEVAGMFA